MRSSEGAVFIFQGCEAVFQTPDFKTEGADSKKEVWFLKKEVWDSRFETWSCEKEFGGPGLSHWSAGYCGGAAGGQPLGLNLMWEIFVVAVERGWGRGVGKGFARSQARTDLTAPPLVRRKTSRLSCCVRDVKLG